MRKTYMTDADLNKKPGSAKQADDKSKSLLDALRDPYTVNNKDFQPDRVDFGNRDAKF